MSNKVNPNDPAYPVAPIFDAEGQLMERGSPGMPIRLQIAKDVLCAMISASEGWVLASDGEELSKRAISITENLIIEYNKTA